MRSVPTRRHQSTGVSDWPFGVERRTAILQRTRNHPPRGVLLMRDRLFQILLRQPARHRTSRRSTYSPRLEHLEDRVTPTTLPTGFSETVIATGLPGPTAMALAPDGRIFVDLEGGDVRVIKDGNLLDTPFL